MDNHTVYYYHYRTDLLARHWSLHNPLGYCRLPGCQEEVGDLIHILLKCPALSASRLGMIKLWSNFMVSKPQLLPIIHHFTIEEPSLLPQFLLDPTCLPLVISTNQQYPETLKHCLYLGQTWCFSAHLDRKRLL